MTINLQKGGRINLSKGNPSLKKVRIGLGWNSNAFDGSSFDADVSAFVCKQDSQGNPSLINEQFMVFYGNLRSPDDAVVHSGDNQTGAGDGDDETIRVDLSKIHTDAVEVSFIVTIHEATKRKQNFGQLTKSYIKLYNDETGAVITTYELEDDFSLETAVQFGSLYRKEGQWFFKAVGQGYQRGLGDFVRVYGAEPTNE